jgi:signal transduction histidine kinase
MHKRLIEEGFNRRYVLLPMLLSMALVVLGYAVVEARRDQARQLTETIRARQDIIRLVVEASYNAMEAESAQRGFLLTGEEQYLTPMDSSLAAANQVLASLRAHYARIDPDQTKVVDGVIADLAIKAREMRESVALLKAGKPREALALVKSDLGLYKAQSVTNAMDGLRAHEREVITAQLESWEKIVRQNTVINTANMVFTLGILVVLGLLATRDIRRRNVFATELATQIDSRTEELRDLSEHMSNVAETEKHALARELHDELGGLLVALRMDVSQIRKRLGPTTDPDLLTRWERIEQAVSQGLELKRRVIEDLRPTLLDNMGLFTALRWLASQRAEQAQLELHMEGLDEDIDLPSQTAIAVFRTVQEGIANIIKHARASRLELKARVAGDQLIVELADDGRGVPVGADQKNGSHGLKQMRFRMEAVGGTLHVGWRSPSGTRIQISVPLEQPAEPAAV